MYVESVPNRNSPPAELLLEHLGTLAYNITHTAINPKAKIILTTRPTPLQDKAFQLLGLSPTCTQ